MILVKSHFAHRYNSNRTNPRTIRRNENSRYSTTGEQEFTVHQKSEIFNHYHNRADIAEIEDHRRATSHNRSEIFELQGEVTAQWQTLDLLIDPVGVAMSSLVSLGEAVDEDRNGIALSYAHSNVPPTDSSNSRGSISGGIGHFESGNAVAFGVSFRFTPNLAGDVGSGIDTCNGSRVSGARMGLVWELVNIGKLFPLLSPADAPGDRRIPAVSSCS